MKNLVGITVASKKIFSSLAKKAKDSKKELQKVNKQNKYLPRLIFEGMFECFSRII